MILIFLGAIGCDFGGIRDAFRNLSGNQALFLVLSILIIFTVTLMYLIGKIFIALQGMYSSQQSGLKVWIAILVIFLFAVSVLLIKTFTKHYCS